MSDSRVSFRPLRSIAAVVAGLLATTVLSVATDLALHAAGIFPPPGTIMSTALFALATAYRIVFAAAGGYVTARLAPNRPVGHALVLGSMGFVLSLIGFFVAWGREAEFGPTWYPIVLVLTAVPATWAGAKLHRTRS